MTGVNDLIGRVQPAAAQEAVAYLDIGAGGYLDIGSDLPEEQLLALPNGRHALGIIGTYGIDGYVSAPVTAAPGIDLTPLWRLSDAWLKEPEGERQSPGENRLRWAMAKELRDALTLLDASPTTAM